jgi:hypothetical protein
MVNYKKRLAHTFIKGGDMDYVRVWMFGILFYTILSLFNGIRDEASNLDYVYFGVKIDVIISVIMGVFVYSGFIFLLGLVVYCADNFITMVIG